MMGSFAKLLAGLSLALRQPLYSYCDVETTHGDALVTKQGDYVSMLRVDGMRRMANRDDIRRIAMAQRIDLSGSLETKGHAIVGFFASDPALSAVEIDRLNMDSCRRVARELNLDLDDILNERARLWPKIMRWEGAYYVLWTRKGVLTKEERKQSKEEQNALAKEWSRVGDSQRFYLRSEIMAARHAAFVDRVLASLRNHDVAATELDAHAALKIARESLYRETAGSAWKPTLVGDRVMPRLPDEDTDKPHPAGLIWPSIREQVFSADAVTRGGQRVADRRLRVRQRRHGHWARRSSAFRRNGRRFGTGSYPVAGRDRDRGRWQDGDGLQGGRGLVARHVPVKPGSASRLCGASP